MRDHIEVVTEGLCHPLGIVEIARRPVTALDDHAGTVADARVARTAVGVELLLSALEYREGNGEGQSVNLVSVLETGVVEVTQILLPARDRVGHLLANGTAVGIERRPALRKELGLVV